MVELPWVSAVHVLGPECPRSGRVLSRGLASRATEPARVAVAGVTLMGRDPFRRFYPARFLGWSADAICAASRHASSSSYCRLPPSSFPLFGAAIPPINVQRCGRQGLEAKPPSAGPPLG